MMKLALPVIVWLGLTLTIPYLAVVTLSPLFGLTYESQTVILRRIYPSLLVAAGVMYLIHWQINKFIRLYEHIKNDKYLVGKRLVNYDPKRNSKISTTSQPQVSPVPLPPNNPARVEPQQQQPFHLHDD